MLQILKEEKRHTVMDGVEVGLGSGVLQYKLSCQRLATHKPTPLHLWVIHAAKPWLHSTLHIQVHPRLNQKLFLPVTTHENYIPVITATKTFEKHI